MGKKQSSESTELPDLPANQPPPVLDENGKVRIIFAHWLRTIISDVNSWPVELANVVLRYYFYRFEWDAPQWRSSGIVLSDDEKLLTMKGHDGDIHGRWASILSKELFSKDTTSILRWEITLKSLGSRWSGFKMGFVNNNVVDLRTDPHSMEFYVKNWGFPRISSQGRQTILHEKWEFAISPGDKFKLYFDFDTRECHAYCNDEYVGLVTKELPKKIHLIARVVDYGCTLESILW